MTRRLHVGILLTPLVACGPAVPPSDAATDSGSGGPTASTTIEGTDSASDSVTSSAMTAGSTGSSDPTSGTTGSTGIDDSGWTGECALVFGVELKPLQIDPGEWSTGDELVLDCVMTSFVGAGEWTADLDCHSDELGLEGPIRMRFEVPDDSSATLVEVDDEPVTVRWVYSMGVTVFAGHLRVADSQGRTLAAWYDTSGSNSTYPWDVVVPELLPELDVDPVEWGCEFGDASLRAIAFAFSDVEESTTLLGGEFGVAGDHLIHLYGAFTQCAEQVTAPNCGSSSSSLQFYVVHTS
jgi:hypothetical protein